MSLLEPIPPACSQACPVGRRTSGLGRFTLGLGSRQAQALCHSKAWGLLGSLSQLGKKRDGAEA